jgi:hypothetical protein
METTTTRPATTTEEESDLDSMDDYGMDGELADQLAASGNYTEDQVMSMTVWQAFACDMKDSPCKPARLGYHRKTRELVQAK